MSILLPRAGDSVVNPPSAAPLCNVVATIVGADGAVMAGAVVEARLSARIVYQGYVVPQRVTATTDANGQCVLPLWPNALGAPTTTFYTVTVRRPRRPTETLRISVPNASSAELHALQIA